MNVLRAGAAKARRAHLLRHGGWVGDGRHGVAGGAHGHGLQVVAVHEGRAALHARRSLCTLQAPPTHRWGCFSGCPGWVRSGKHLATDGVRQG